MANARHPDRIHNHPNLDICQRDTAMILLPAITATGLQATVRPATGSGRITPTLLLATEVIATRVLATMVLALAIGASLPGMAVAATEDNALVAAVAAELTTASAPAEGDADARLIPASTHNTMHTSTHNSVQDYPRRRMYLGPEDAQPLWQAIAMRERQYQDQLGAPIRDQYNLQDSGADDDADFAIDMPPEFDADETATLDSLINSTRQDRNADDMIAAEIRLDDPQTVDSIQADDLWSRIRQGFRLKDYDHPRVKQHLDWFASHQEYLDRVVARAQPFLYDIVQETARLNIPMEVALLPVVESAFQPFAYSPGRASGIWQFIPATGARYGLKQNWWYDGRRDVPASTRAALRYLTDLKNHFNGDWLLALAAYNSGEGRVLRAVRKNQEAGRDTDFWSLDLPEETREYVPKLLAISAIVENSAAHGIDLISIADEPYLTQVNIGSQIDLAMAAELSGLPIDTIYQLNPAFNRWATDPDGPHVLSVPLGVSENFKATLAQLDKSARIQWQRHQIRPGETLGQIARKYQTTISVLQRINKIDGKWIRAGQNIIIPVAAKDLRQYLSEDQRRLSVQHTPRDGNKVQHRVQKGDTLWSISLQYDVTINQLATWNSMAPRDTIKPGQDLVIWSGSKPARTLANVASPLGNNPPSDQTRQRVQYKVRKGDSLALIARKFNVTINNLRNWNSLPEDRHLQPGQLLTLFVDVTRQSQG